MLSIPVLIKKIIGSDNISTLRRRVNRLMFFYYDVALRYNIRKHKILIAGCAYNVEKYLPQVLENINFIASLFADNRIVFVESDSNDLSGIMLEQWAAKDKDRRTVFRLGELKETMPKRTDRIAYCRNKYVELFDTMNLYEKFDILLILDMDNVSSESLDLIGFISCFYPPRWSTWDVLSANRRGLYYDIWALRCKNWCEYDCWERVRNRPQDMDYQAAVNYFVSSKKKNIPSNSDWMQCDSAFGGMAIYKTRLLHNCRYTGLTLEGHEVCEHVEFHHALAIKGGKLFINPRFIMG